MPTDPLDALQLPIEPVAPRADFAADLRRRLERTLMPESRPAYVPPRLHTVTPYLAVSDARAAIDWYKQIFGAVDVSEAIIMDDGRVGHAEIAIGDAVLMISDEWPELDERRHLRQPLHDIGRARREQPPLGPGDRVPRQMADGLEQPVEDQFHGSRAGWLVDPWGHRWNVGTPIS